MQFLTQSQTTLSVGNSRADLQDFYWCHGSATVPDAFYDTGCRCFYHLGERQGPLHNSVVGGGGSRLEGRFNKVSMGQRNLSLDYSLGVPKAENPNKMLKGTWNRIGKFLVALFFLATLGPSLAHGNLQQQFEDFINVKRQDSNGWHLIITNHSPSIAFKDMASMQAAMKNSNVVGALKNSQVMQQLLFADLRLGNIYFNEQRSGSSERTVFTNRFGLIWGKSSNEWWIAQRHGFQILQGSEDGAWYDSKAGKTNRFFVSTYERSLLFYRVGLPEMLLGTFRIEGSLGPDWSTWSATNRSNKRIVGAIKQAGDELIIRSSPYSSTEQTETVVTWNRDQMRPQNIRLFKVLGQEYKPLLSVNVFRAVQARELVSASIYSFMSHTNNEDVLVYLAKDTGARIARIDGKSVNLLPSRDVHVSGIGVGGKIWILISGFVITSGALLYWMFMKPRDNANK